MASTDGHATPASTPRNRSPGGSPRSRSPSGTPRSPSSREAFFAAKVLDLQERLAPTLVAHSEAARFLSAKKGDVAKAAKLYQRCLAWRAEANIDGILDEREPTAEEAALGSLYSPVVLDGTDLQGRPVMYSHMGKIDMAALSVRGVSVPVVARRHIRELERCRRRLIEQQAEREGDPYRPPAVPPEAAPDGSGRPARAGHVLIVDVEGGVVGRFLGAWKLWAEVARLEGNYYPHMMARCVVIHAPPVANWAFGLCRKSFLDPATAERVSLHSDRDASVALREVLSEEVMQQLPPGVLSTDVAGDGGGKKGAAGGSGTSR